MSRRLAAALAALLAFGAGAARSDETAQPLEATSQRGPVSVTLKLSPPEPVIGDELQLEIEAVADEGVELLMPEFGEALDRFRIVDFAQRESVDAQGRTHALQSYTLASPSSGQQRLPPLQVEFVDRRPGEPPAPEGEDAYELLTEPLEFSVASVLPSGAVLDLPPPPDRLALLSGASRNAWLLGLGGLALLLVLAPFAWRAWSRRRAVVRQQSAFELAESRLARLLARGRAFGAEQVGAFYVELSGVVRSYLEDRFDLRSPELTTEEFFEAARRSSDLTAELQALVIEFLVRADLVKFARHLPGEAEIDAAIAAVRDVLEWTRDPAAVEPVQRALPAEPAGV